MMHLRVATSASIQFDNNRIISASHLSSSSDTTTIKIFCPLIFWYNIFQNKTQCFIIIFWACDSLKLRSILYVYTNNEAMYKLSCRYASSLQEVRYVLRCNILHGIESSIYYAHRLLNQFQARLFYMILPPIIVR